MKPANWRRADKRVTAVVIGGGQSGLATSHELSRRGIDHVVLERGDVANAWSTERWDSLRLLTPNWQTQLPGYTYDGANPDGFMSATELTDFIRAYARVCSAPVQVDTCVTSVAPAEGGYRVATTRGSWLCNAVVLASGAYTLPAVPAVSAALPARIRQLTPHQYRNPEQLGSEGVLIVGASATGVQIAREVQDSGRQVTLAVGEHVRLPRMYRGRDIQYWMHVTGLLDQACDEVDDLSRVRGLPSPQLIGHPDHINVDLNALGDQGVNLVGRLVGVRGSTAQFSGSLANVIRMADLKQQRLLRTIDEWISRFGAQELPAPADPPAPTRLGSPPRLTMDIGNDRIGAVIWATGFRPDFSWLNVPVLDTKGRLLHDGGVTPSPGLYAMGLPFMRKRKSAFIFGAGDDASAIARHLAGHIHNRYQSTLVGVA